MRAYLRGTGPENQRATEKQNKLSKFPLGANQRIDIPCSNAKHARNMNCEFSLLYLGCCTNLLWHHVFLIVILHIYINMLMMARGMKMLCGRRYKHCLNNLSCNRYRCGNGDRCVSKTMLYTIDLWSTFVVVWNQRGIKILLWYQKYWMIDRVTAIAVVTEIVVCQKRCCIQ